MDTGLSIRRLLGVQKKRRPFSRCGCMIGYINMNLYLRIYIYTHKYTYIFTYIILVQYSIDIEPEATKPEKKKTGLLLCEECSSGFNLSLSCNLLWPGSGRVATQLGYVFTNAFLVAILCTPKIYGWHIARTWTFQMLTSPQKKNTSNVTNVTSRQMQGREMAREFPLVWDRVLECPWGMAVGRGNPHGPHGGPKDGWKGTWDTRTRFHTNSCLIRLGDCDFADGFFFEITVTMDFAK